MVAAQKTDFFSSWIRLIASVVLLGTTLCVPCVLGTSSSDYDLFPLLMPKVQPTQEESYICTPIKVSEDETYYIKGFQPNATGHTAHHMLIYGCDAPGSSDEAMWNCGRSQGTIFTKA